MHAQSNVQITSHPADSLVLEILPNGEPAWLRPDTEEFGKSWSAAAGTRLIEADHFSVLR